jgi:hypothetical protein
LIECALAKAKFNLGVAEDCDWLNGYYQYCNRIAVLEFLTRYKASARLMFIYFTGDKWPGENGNPICPKDSDGWQSALETRKAHVGLGQKHALAKLVNEVFLEV